MRNSRFNFFVGIAILFFLGALLTSCEKEVASDWVQQAQVETQNTQYSGKTVGRVYIDLSKDPITSKVDDFADFVGLELDNAEDIVAIEIGTSFGLKWVNLEEDVYGVVGFENAEGIYYREGWVKAGTQALVFRSIDGDEIKLLRTILGDFDFPAIEASH